MLFAGIECIKIMSRNITKAIKRVVEKIQDVIDKKESYTIDGDPTCIDWLKFLKIDNKIRLFPDFYSAWLTYENDNYLVLVNHKFRFFPISIFSFLQEETPNSGAWVVIIDELDLSMKKDTDISILDEILDNEWKIEESKKGEKFNAVNIEEEINGVSLKDCFPSIALYKINSRFTQKEELSQITGIALTTSNTYCLLPYTNFVLQEFKKTFENGNKYIPFENILASYVASDFKFAYLDLYRCIERLQPLYFFKPFYDKLALTGTSLEDFYNDFYENTKLEPKFEDSLNNLIKSLSINYKYADKQRKYSASSYLYRLRNQIVHLRPNQKNDLLPKSIQEWNLLILDMLTIVQELYKTHQNLLT